MTQIMYMLEGDTKKDLISLHKSLEDILNSNFEFQHDECGIRIYNQLKKNTSKYVGTQVVARMYFEDKIENYWVIPGMLYNASIFSGATPLKLIFHNKKESKSYSVDFSFLKPKHQTYAEIEKSANFSAIMIVSESHFALHYFEEEKYIDCDIYTCGETSSILGYLYIYKAINPKKACGNYLIRGLLN